MQLIKVSLYHQFSPIEVLGLINKITEALALTQHIKECKIEYTGNLTETSICMEIPDSITLFNGKQLLSDVLDGFINNFYLVTYSITVSKLITTKRVFSGTTTKNNIDLEKCLEELLNAQELKKIINAYVAFSDNSISNIPIFLKDLDPNLVPSYLQAYNFLRLNVNTLILIMCADLVYAILLDGYMIKHYQDHLPNMEYNTYSDHYIFLDTNTNKSTYVMRL